jgi:hypothetical protein
MSVSNQNGVSKREAFVGRRVGEAFAAWRVANDLPMKDRDGKAGSTACEMAGTLIR